jgi:hypothetical protein
MDTIMDSGLQRYGDFRPTSFDSAGAFLPDRRDWLVAPVVQNRDSGPLDKSNFEAALEMLGGESESVEVHRFGHWGPGWFEIIIVDPADEARLGSLLNIAESLENYPVLDEEDHSRREWNDYQESWDSWACGDFRRGLLAELADDCGAAASAIEDCGGEQLQEFYESLIPSGDYYICESSGVSVQVDYALNNLTRERLAEFICDIRRG